MRATIGKFEILRQLGQGAMGEVYLGRDPGLQREVAIKTIRPGTDFGPEASARFEREARAGGGLSHPNVAMVYEFGEDDGLRFLAMEYVEGGDLAALIGVRPKEELLELLAQACEGLSFAHERGIIHRDIKPANILVSNAGRRPVAKLVDFGVALVGQSDLTEKGEWMGTVNYMAPEYLDSGQAVPASDLFAMGVILYEILSGGRRPFEGGTASAVLNAILRLAPAPLPPAEVQNLNPALLDVVNRALAKAPGDRHPSAEALAQDLRQALAGATPPAPEPATEAAQGPEATTLVVGKGGKGQCMSLRVALRQARAGMQILVLPGIYREALVVDKAVTILGQGEPGEVVVESPKGPCFALEAPWVRLDNLTLVGAPDAPALLVPQGQATVENCDLQGRGGPAVHLTGAGGEPLFRQCTLGGEGAAALVFEANAGGRFEGCRVEGQFLTGVSVAAGARPALVDCRILTVPGVGLRLLPGGHALLTRCQFSGQLAGGVEVEAEGRAELRQCRISASASVGVLALERGQLDLEECEVDGHAAAGVHGVEGAVVQLRSCRVHDNGGFGASVMGAGLLTMDQCEVSANLEPGVLMHSGATVQMKACKVFDGQSFGVVCARGARGVLEGCEIYGNARTGAKVEAGGSLLLVRCALRDGRDTGILLFEDAEVTLEECVVHRNARGGILLAKDASDPVLRGGNQIQDQLLRAGDQGGVVRVSQVKQR